MNLRLLEDRIEKLYRRTVDMQDELAEAETQEEADQINDDIDYYNNLLEKAEEKYLKAGGKNLA